MDFEFLGPMIVGVVGFLTVGAVIAFSPLSRRLAALLEVMAQERGQSLRSELRRMGDLLDSTLRRLELLEERQEFTDELLRAQNSRRQLKGCEQGPPTV